MIHCIETTTGPVPSAGASARWDEGDVVARAKKHSETAFEQLVEHYERRAFRLAWKITCNHEDAEDVVQNAFAKVFQNLPEFRGDSRFYTWLVRITINEALMKIRRRHSNEVSIDESKKADDTSVPIVIMDQASNPEQRYSQYEANATYRNHGSHAEAIEIVFDLRKLSYRKLLEFFFQIHDPTTMNQQGNDRGLSYRSAIFYTSDQQKRITNETIADVNASGLWPGRVVTEVVPAGAFWEAEPEHQEYLEKFPNGYTCHFIRPGWKLPSRAASTRTS
jgi:peptide-methionine (S)-S-oxide reductase